jgi:hypothetical protein
MIFSIRRQNSFTDVKMLKLSLCKKWKENNIKKRKEKEKEEEEL